VGVSFDLTGKTALVTGGSAGIGLGMAEGLARAGAGVAIWGRSEAKLDAAKQQLEQHGGTVVAIPCDVGDEAQVDRAFSDTVAQLGHVDTCIANAGVGTPPRKFEDQRLDEWRAVLQTNLEGSFLTLRAATRHMIERGEGGSLVGLSSIGSVDGMPRAQAYAASKAGITALMNGLAVELARHRIRANTVLPGWIKTDLTPHLDSEPMLERVLPRVPARRWGEPADFAGIAVYLASDASAYHSGDTFIIDGAYDKF
jgi:NAD(P)-dependent dehydrogenase (short-subunit alcohol dehydrogenase family)